MQSARYTEFPGFIQVIPPSLVVLSLSAYIIADSVYNLTSDLRLYPCSPSSDRLQVNASR